MVSAQHYLTTVSYILMTSHSPFMGRMGHKGKVKYLTDKLYITVAFSYLIFGCASSIFAVLFSQCYSLYSFIIYAH